MSITRTMALAIRDSAWGDYHEAVKIALAAAEAHGYVLVPKDEVTDEMINAGGREAVKHAVMLAPKEYRGIFRAMIAARPAIESEDK